MAGSSAPPVRVEEVSGLWAAWPAWWRVFPSVPPLQLGDLLMRDLERVRHLHGLFIGMLGTAVSLGLRDGKDMKIFLEVCDLINERRSASSIIRT
jgi:hypothetical protein